MSEEANVEMSAGETRPRLSLDILSSIKEAQSQHGLRHNNYVRYRQYCSRRLRRLRKGCRVGQKSRSRPQPITVDVVSEARHLMIPLVSAERAWSHAMQLKNENSSESSSVRLHGVRRLGKASRNAEDLRQLCAARADERTNLEAEAYASYMRAMLSFERGEWKEAMDGFAKTKVVYDDLARSGSDAFAQTCSEFLGEIEPRLRYCEYNLRREGSAGKEGKSSPVPSLGASMAALDLSVGARVAAVSKKETAADVGQIELRAVPCHPIMFDVASNYVQYPSLQHRFPSQKARAQKEKRREEAEEKVAEAMIQEEERRVKEGEEVKEEKKGWFSSWWRR